jgi:hypothetical protein
VWRRMDWKASGGRGGERWPNLGHYAGILRVGLSITMKNFTVGITFICGRAECRNMAVAVCADGTVFCRTWPCWGTPLMHLLDVPCRM